MNQPAPRSVALQHDKVLWRQLDDEILVLDVSRSRYLRLNHSGAVLWQALDEPRAPGELVDVLRRTYAISETEARGDVASFLRRLGEHGLLRDAA